MGARRSHKGGTGTPEHPAGEERAAEGGQEHNRSGKNDLAGGKRSVAAKARVDPILNQQSYRKKNDPI